MGKLFTTKIKMEISIKDVIGISLALAFTPETIFLPAKTQFIQ